MGSGRVTMVSMAALAEIAQENLFLLEVCLLLWAAFRGYMGYSEALSGRKGKAALTRLGMAFSRYGLLWDGHDTIGRVFSGLCV